MRPPRCQGDGKRSARLRSLIPRNSASRDKPGGIHAHGSLRCPSLILGELSSADEVDRPVCADGPAYGVGAAAVGRVRKHGHARASGHDRCTVRPKAEVTLENQDPAGKRPRWKWLFRARRSRSDRRQAVLPHHVRHRDGCWPRGLRSDIEQRVRTAAQGCHTDEQERDAAETNALDNPHDSRPPWVTPFRGSAAAPRRSPSPLPPVPPNCSRRLKRHGPEFGHGFATVHPFGQRAKRERLHFRHGVGARGAAI